MSSNLLPSGGRRVVALALVFVMLALPGRAQVPADLGQMSIEELMSIEVTAAARKDQRAWDVAGAIFVINQDDIRRSGMTTVPELLRLAPGVDVAQITSNKWAVSVRGFNGGYANKLLVLVDGRSVYNRIFSGVTWDSQDLMVDDIDRIEVIRGPGAALWGANAVNGVINIVSKNAAATQGALVRADLGSSQQGAVRYGGMAGATPFRLHAQWTDRNETEFAGARAGDPSRSVSAGFRAERGPQPSAIMLQGGLTAGRSQALYSNLDPRTAARDPIAADRSESLTGFLLGRWTRTGEEGDALQVQSFLDGTSRQEAVGDYSRRAFDLDAHYRRSVAGRHDLVLGAGYRFVGERFDGGVGYLLTPASDDSSLVTAFVQDEIALTDRLHFTIGTQLQYQSGVGSGVQPTARVMWRPSSKQRLWAAVSRALRTPSLTDRGIRVDYPPAPSDSGLPLYVTTLGSPATTNETFVDVEAGYRREVGSRAVIDVTGFIGRYSDLQTTEPGAPAVEFVPSPRIVVTTAFSNQLSATTRGLEVAAHWAPVAGWQVDGSFTAFRLDPSLGAASHDASAATTDGSAPRTQWQARSTYAPTGHATLNVALFRVGAIEQLQVPAYTRLDASAEWRFTDRLSVMAIGQNLADDAHAEFDGTTSLVRATEVRRSAGLRLRWTFR